MEEGCEDRYLFVQKSYSGKSLLDVLELNDSMNDIFSNQRLTGILSGIAYNEGEHDFGFFRRYLSDGRFVWNDYRRAWP